MAWITGTGPDNAVLTTPEDWRIDELAVSTVAYNVASTVLSVPAPKGAHITLPGQDGYTFTPNRSFSPGEFALSMWVIGAEPDGTIPGTRTLRRGLFERNLHHLLSIATNTSRPVLLSKRQPGTTARRWAYGSVEDSTSIETMMSRQRAVFSLVFSLGDSFWADDSLTSATSTANSTLPKTLDLTAAASMSAPVKDAVVTVTGPVTNPRITNPETGVWVEMVGTLASGAVWTVDSGAYTSKVGAANVTTRHGGHPRFVYIPTRQGNTSIPRLVLSGTGGGTLTKFSVSFRRKWALP